MGGKKGANGVEKDWKFWGDEPPRTRNFGADFPSGTARVTLTRELRRARICVFRNPLDRRGLRSKKGGPLGVVNRSPRGGRSEPPSCDAGA